MTVFEKEKLQDPEIFPKGLLERIYTLFPDLVEAEIDQFSIDVADAENWNNIGILFKDGRFFHGYNLKTGYPQYSHPLEIFTLYWNGVGASTNCDYWVTNVFEFSHVGRVIYHGMKLVTVKAGTTEIYITEFSTSY
jgi:hypothetical protein